MHNNNITQVQPAAFLHAENHYIQLIMCTRVLGFNIGPNHFIFLFSVSHSLSL